MSRAARACHLTKPREEHMLAWRSTMAGWHINQAAPRRLAEPPECRFCGSLPAQGRSYSPVYLGMDPGLAGPQHPEAHGRGEHRGIPKQLSMVPACLLLDVVRSMLATCSSAGGNWPTLRIAEPSCCSWWAHKQCCSTPYLSLGSVETVTNVWHTIARLPNGKQYF